MADAMASEMEVEIAVLNSGAIKGSFRKGKKMEGVPHFQTNVLIWDTLVCGTRKTLSLKSFEIEILASNFRRKNVSRGHMQNQRKIIIIVSIHQPESFLLRY